MALFELVCDCNGAQKWFCKTKKKFGQVDFLRKMIEIFTH